MLNVLLHLHSCRQHLLDHYYLRIKLWLLDHNNSYNTTFKFLANRATQCFYALSSQRKRGFRHPQAVRVVPNWVPSVPNSSAESSDVGDARCQQQSWVYARDSSEQFWACRTVRVHPEDYQREWMWKYLALCLVHKGVRQPSGSSGEDSDWRTEGKREPSAAASALALAGVSAGVWS